MSTKESEQEVSEALKPEAAARANKRLKPIDIVAIVVVTIIIGILGWTLYSKLSLKHDVAAAQVVADQTIAALQKRDGAAARKLGNAKFQSTYTSEALTKQFKAVEVATSQNPELLITTVYNGKDGRTVYFIYGYSALKVPYFIRTAILEKDGQWKLVNISGNADQSKLLVAQ